MSSNTTLFISSFLVVAAIVVLAVSTFGLGKEQHDKKSPAYTTASVFTVIGSVATVAAIGALVFTSIRNQKVSRVAQAF